MINSCEKYNVQAFTLDEKVGQLLIVHIQGETVNDNCRSLIQDTKVGGVIYYNWSNGLHSPGQVKALSQDLQNLTLINRISIPLFIATDQEGGVVTRLKKGFTEFPGNKAIAMAGDLVKAEKVAFIMGKELLAVGINMNLSPVVDVNINSKNPVIGVRSFGSDPQTVIDFGKKILQGYKRSNIMTVMKHFPGHGDTVTDSHEGLPVVNKSLESLTEVELLPFQKLKLYSDVIMTAHLLVPSLDPDHCSTLSSKTLTYLRDVIGFQGVIMSDSLVMKGVLKIDQTIDEIAIKALVAGCDLLLLGGRELNASDGLELNYKDIKRIHQSVVDAVKHGLILEERVTKSVERILKLKENYFNQGAVDLLQMDVNGMLSSIDSETLAKEIATDALKILNLETYNNINISDKNVLIVAPCNLYDRVHETSIKKIGKKTEMCFFDAFYPSEKEIEEVKILSRKVDVLIIYSYQAWKNPLQEHLIHSLLNMQKTSILIVTRDENDAELFPNSNLIIKTYSDSEASLQAVSDKLIAIYS